ncbi:hypothetical protein BJ508DRAFT_360473 [Ascobolus immersus RN42]|uniref:N-alpha-acetyltransferase 40 n=1 Tax=Ascobolus immersus RN42 TaxID=1160509 RepID=A0A3N4IH75_ASCIM|nr:hypothetical protein BJ508DRAFT_360473 [Ascobolus immersus RN42]
MSESNLVETFNVKTLEDLQERFVPKELIEVPFRAKDGRSYKATLETSTTLDDETLQTCFQLVKDGCKDMYDRSEMRWSNSKKKEEMRMKGMNFLVLRDSETTEFAGFLSMLVTVEEGEELIYCYELHITPSKHGLGLGRYLMQIFEEFGRNVGFVKLAMLTVFTENKPARDFYTKLGYQLDDCSPEPRRLRNGVVKQPTYQILSKVINENPTYENQGYERMETPGAE